MFTSSFLCIKHIQPIDSRHKKYRPVLINVNYTKKRYEGSHYFCVDFIQKTIQELALIVITITINVAEVISTEWLYRMKAQKYFAEKLVTKCENSFTEKLMKKWMEIFIFRMRNLCTQITCHKLRAKFPILAANTDKNWILCGAQSFRNETDYKKHTYWNN